MGTETELTASRLQCPRQVVVDHEGVGDFLRGHGARGSAKRQVIARKRDTAGQRLQYKSTRY